jgi:hypothetical protein
MLTQLQTQQIRLSILRYCDASVENGLTPALLLQFLRTEGFRSLDLDRLRAEIQYLADKDLLVAPPNLISPEIKNWRITATGRDLLAGNTQEAA